MYNKLLTLFFRHPVTSGQAFRDATRLLHFNRHRFRKIKLAGIMMFVISPGNTYHLHMLLTSDPTYPKTISDLNWNKVRTTPRWLAFYWQQWDKGSCKVKKADNEGKISGYLTSWKNLRLADPDKWDFRYYRQKVLEKLVVR
jgi:hypothetical protein